MCIRDSLAVGHAERLQQRAVGCALVACFDLIAVQTSSSLLFPAGLPRAGPKLLKISILSVENLWEALSIKKFACMPADGSFLAAGGRRAYPAASLTFSPAAGRGEIVG